MIKKLLEKGKESLLSTLPILLIVLLLHFTIAEPDLTVLANQVPSIPNPVLIWTVAMSPP